MPACLASTRNSVLSLTLVVTVAVTRHLVDALGDRLGADVEVDLDLRLLLLEQDLRRVRLLERQVLQVDALDLETGSCWLSSAMVSLGGMKGPRPASGLRGDEPAIAVGQAIRRGWRAAARAPPRAVERDQVVAAADVGSPMKICGTVRRPVSCIISARCAGLEVDADLLDRSTPRCLQQRLGALAVRADRGAVHLHGLASRRRRQAVFSTGRLASRQAPRPPASARASRSRASSATATARRRTRAGRADDHERQRLVLRQVAASASSCASGTFFAPSDVAGGVLGRLAARRSARAFSRLISCTASAGEPRPPPCRRAEHRPQQHAAGDERDGEQVPVVEEEFHRASQPGRGKAANYRIRARSHRCTHRPIDAMYKLVLIRHGESTWNLENRFTGWTDVDLTADRRRAGARRRPAAEGRGLRLRPRLHLGAQARDPHALASRSTSWTGSGCRCTTTGA